MPQVVLVSACFWSTSDGVKALKESRIARFKGAAGFYAGRGSFASLENNMMKWSDRREKARELHQVATQLLREKGKFEKISGSFQGQPLIVELEQYHLALRTPFNCPLPPPTEFRRYLMALTGTAALNLPYGLDIWEGKKVLNLEWDIDNNLEIVSFKRGIWEQIFLAKARSEL
jgi:hypothetical protein